MIVSEWLKGVLEKRGMSNNELAELAAGKMSRASVYFYVNGTRIPNRSQLEKLAGVLGIAADQIPQYEMRKVGQPAQKKNRRS